MFLLIVKPGLYQFVFAINKILAEVVGRYMRTIQVNGFLGARLLTKTAEYAAKHIDLIYGGVLFFPIQVLFAFLPLGRNHGDGFSGARQRAQPTGGTPFPTLFIAL